MFLILIVKKKHSHPIDRIRNQLPCSLPKMVVGGVIYRLGYNDRIKYLCKKIVCENRQGGVVA